MTESNNEFFSYQGSISRKNYLINMLILIALYFCLSLVKFENFIPFISYKFLFYILMFFVSLLKFTILMSAISVVFRRITDFSRGKSYKFNVNMKRIFVFLFVFPILYFFCIRYFIDIIPFLTQITDIIVIYILMPAGLLSSIIFCFLKGK